MNNFPVIVDGKEYWISRSVAVGAYIFALIDGKICILANKRGPGLPNNVGKWSVVSGFLDFNETILKSLYREVWEETNINLDEHDCEPIKLMEIDDDPTRPGQVILFRYSTRMYDPEKAILSDKNSEPNEVDEIRWVPINDLPNYDWTSERAKERIKSYAKYWFPTFVDIKYNY